MDRSLGARAILVLLAMTGLGQVLASGGGAPIAGKETLITINDPGRPSQRCRLLRMWNEPGGGRACIAQSVETGQLITIIEVKKKGVPGAGGQSVPMRIYYWHGSTPPSGAPLPAVKVQVFGEAITKQVLSPAIASTGEPPVARPVLTPGQQNVQPAPAARAWAPAHGTRPVAAEATATIVPVAGPNEMVPTPPMPAANSLPIHEERPAVLLAPVQSAPGNHVPRRAVSQAGQPIRPAPSPLAWPPAHGKRPVTTGTLIAPTIVPMAGANSLTPAAPIPAANSLPIHEERTEVLPPTAKPAEQPENSSREARSEALPQAVSEGPTRVEAAPPAETPDDPVPIAAAPFKPTEAATLERPVTVLPSAEAAARPAAPTSENKASEVVDNVPVREETVPVGNRLQAIPAVGRSVVVEDTAESPRQRRTMMLRSWWRDGLFGWRKREGTNAVAAPNAGGEPDRPIAVTDAAKVEKVEKTVSNTKDQAPADDPLAHAPTKNERKAPISAGAVVPMEPDSGPPTAGRKSPSKATAAPPAISQQPRLPEVTNSTPDSRSDPLNNPVEFAPKFLKTEVDAIIRGGDPKGAPPAQPSAEKAPSTLAAAAPPGNSGVKSVPSLPELPGVAPATQVVMGPRNADIKSVPGLPALPGAAPVSTANQLQVSGPPAPQSTGSATPDRAQSHGSAAETPGPNLAAHQEQAPVQVVPIGIPAAPTMAQMLSILGWALDPACREWAAGMLASRASAWPEVQQALMTAVREDPAPTVRAACLRHLGRIKPPGALTVAQSALEDFDARVRAAANDCVSALSRRIASPEGAGADQLTGSSSLPVRAGGSTCNPTPP